jgi:threonine/homoserine/homoserine lactone efflux protein
MITFIDTLVLGISLTLPPGPVTLEIFTRGVHQGWRSALSTILGAFLAELLFFSAVYGGIVRFFQFDGMRQVLGCAGVLFLWYLAYQHIRESFRKGTAEPVVLVGSGALSGFLITFFNPSNIILWVGIISGFFAAESTLFTSSGILVGILGSFLFVATVSLLGRQIFRMEYMRYISAVAGCCFFYFGLKLLVGLIGL